MRDVTIRPFDDNAIDFMHETTKALAAGLARRVGPGPVLLPAGTWRKVCHCDGPAETGRVTLTQETVDDRWVRLVARLIPGPSCTVCGRAWEREGETED